MAVELKVPAVGESITEVEIGAWLKAEGDLVKKDEPVVTLESEKATVELPAPAEGILSKVLKKAGDTAAIGEAIAHIEKDGKSEVPPKTAGPMGNAAKVEEAPRIMPAAEHALAEHKLESKEVQPTGPGGRLLKEDVLREASLRPVASDKHRPTALPPSAESRAVSETQKEPVSQQAPPPAAARPEEVVRMT